MPHPLGSKRSEHAETHDRFEYARIYTHSLVYIFLFIDFGPPTVTSMTLAFICLKEVRPPSDDGRRVETEAFPETAIGMSEMDLVALEEQVRMAGGTSGSPVASRSPFASTNTSISPTVFPLPYCCLLLCNCIPLIRTYRFNVFA